MFLWEIIKQIDLALRQLDRKSTKLSTDALLKLLQRNSKKSIELLGSFSVNTAGKKQFVW